MKPLGDAFIALIKMMIAPVIFCTVVHGIGSMRDLKQGRPRRRQDAALFRGRLDHRARHRASWSANVLQPGTGFNIDPATLDPKAVANYVTAAKQEGVVGHLLGIIPDSFFGALARGDLLQVLLVSDPLRLRHRAAGRASARRSTTPSTPPPSCSSASSASSCVRRRSARSAPWPSPSAPMGSARWSTCCS